MFYSILETYPRNIFLGRNIKIRPASVKTFDEITMENGPDENHGVS